MVLEAGTQFGHYRIVAPIGAGGMGEVYRATDTKLGRDVAIKTLPATLAEDKDRLARFEREARLLAALNHPHIAAVHSLDEHADMLYIAMELVQGETLEQRLKQGALPVTDALQIALQLAEALEAAHGKGVVHRDLKPANIIVDENGQVKVLDFGLAKAFSGPPDEASPLHSPALSVAMTQQGLVLGTAGYMSPEQASGQGTDQRGDVWAFGVVLYEMLTGLPLFRGESVPHILADVLKTEPDWSRLPPNLHPRLKLMLERCLTKRPQSRLHSIADARIEIEAVLAAPEGVQPAPSPVEGTTARPRWLRLAAAGLAIAVVAAGAGWFLRPEPPGLPQPVVRFSIPLPEEQAFTALPLPLLTVSSDGMRIAYVANDRIFLRNLQETEARPVAGTDRLEGVGASSPVFSPDGEWLAFVHVLSATGPFHVLRVPVSGGAPQRVYSAGTDGFPMGLSWPEPDRMLFSTPADGVVAMPANGGDIEVLVPAVADEGLYSPQLLPGGEAVLFASAPAQGNDFSQAEIFVQSIGADDRKLLTAGRAPRYLSTGHLVYANGMALFGIAFDPESRSVSGGAVPLLNGLRGATPPVSDTGNFVISDTGTLVSIPGTGPETGDGSQILTTLSWVDRNGRAEPLPLRADDYTAVRISPDGTRAALTVGNQLARGMPSTVWIYDFDSTNLSLLTTDPPAHDGPVWAPDGQRLYFRSPSDTVMEIFEIDLETRAVTPVYSGSAEFGAFPMPWSVSDAEDVLTIINAQTNTEVDFAMISLPDGEFVKGLDGEGMQNQPVISPNGLWLAYTEGPLNASGEINLRPYPNFGRTRIPVGPGLVSVFTRDGAELLVGDENTISAYPVTYEPTLRVGEPQQIFQSSEYLLNFFGRVWDVDPTGERLLMIRQPGATNSNDADGVPEQRLEVVLNWVEELSQRVPVGRQ